MEAIKSLTRATAFGDSLAEIKVQVPSILKDVFIDKQQSNFCLKTKTSYKLEILKDYEKTGD